MPRQSTDTPPERKPGFSRDRDLERSRETKRPADAEMDATERSADRKPEEHIDYPADVDEDAPDRDALGSSGQ